MNKTFVRLFFIISSVLFLMPGVSGAQGSQADGESPPIEQPLVREGDFALTLVEALSLGATEDETEATNILNAAGIAPENGWVADYPVTPDVVGELQSSVGDAADAGRLSIGKDAALIVFRDVVSEYGLSIRVGEGQGATGWGEDPASEDLNNYYETAGPPVITYYAPPPAYAYMYTWVPYPFWWWNFWYPGYFVLVDFDVRIHLFDRVRIHPHDRFRPHFHERPRPVPHDRVRLDERARPRIKDRGPGKFISNYFHERRTDSVRRIDPTKRSRSVIFPSTGTARTEFGGTRGFNAPRPHGGTRSSAFDRSGSGRVDGAASDRGFRSRTGAGIVPRREVPAREVAPQRVITPREKLDRDRSVQDRLQRDRPAQGAVKTGEPRKLDVRREGFRDSRGGTFHGGGRRQR